MILGAASRYRGLALAAGLIFSAMPTAAEEVFLGPLVLEFDAARWMADKDKETKEVRATLRCVAPSCHGAVVDLDKVVDGTDNCTRRGMYEAAVAAFPTARYHAINPRIVGNLILYVAVSGRARNPEAGRAIRACVFHDGATIHATSRTGPVDGQEFRWADPGQVAAIQALLRGLRASADGPRSLAVGGLVVHYDSAAWRGRRLDDLDDRAGDGAAAAASASMRWRFDCLPPACGAGAYVMLGISSRDCTALEISGWNRSEEPWASGLGPLDFRTRSIHLGCRNLVPRVHEACATHAGVTYHLESGPGATCRTMPGVPFATFRDLLAGIRPAD